MAQINITLSVAVPFGLLLSYIIPNKGSVINLVVLLLSFFALAGIAIDNTMHFKEKVRFHSSQEARYSALILKLKSNIISKEDAIIEAQKLMLNNGEEP